MATQRDDMLGPHPDVASLRPTSPDAALGEVYAYAQRENPKTAPF
ncbi:hypothetical protein Fuma_03904 [Fuerstiella marisgermanici]|uniref:Uncharacterized protein n=1 Tax=Fuerstiella marisgermanici TaxID=1891926 RepID=A0A1P8WJQ1_9PLAN|nr:hypothetical protein Fuma_03904 [Fuerstiella marisgermanici]